MKICGTCKKNLKDSLFYRYKDRLQSSCKSCQNEQSRIRNKTPKRMEYNRIIQRKIYKDRKETYFSRPEIKKRYADYQAKYRKDPILRMRHEARWQTTRAIRSGFLKRLPCEVCGNKKTHAHHDDYYKPLEVRWLCHDHHAEYHRKNKAQFGGKK